PRLQYRGSQFDLVHFERWARQFPRELSALSVHLIREIAERYYVGVREFYEGLDFLIRNSDIPRGSCVTFCRWQEMGRSAPSVAHELKNQARWRPVGEIDLDEDEHRWPDLSSFDSHFFVLAVCRGMLPGRHGVSGATQNRLTVAHREA